MKTPFQKKNEALIKQYLAKGGPGSGNHGHAGVTGQRGGSAPKGEGGDSRVDRALPDGTKFKGDPLPSTVERTLPDGTKFRGDPLPDVGESAEAKYASLRSEYNRVFDEVYAKQRKEKEGEDPDFEPNQGFSMGVGWDAVKEMKNRYPDIHEDVWNDINESVGFGISSYDRAETLGHLKEKKK